MEKLANLYPNTFPPHIDLSNKQLKQIDANAFRYVKNTLLKLSLNSNQLENITSQIFVNFIYLEELYLNNNRLSSLPPKAFIHMVHLKRLNLSNNNIEEIDAESFSGLVELNFLSLHNNRIKRLSENTFKTMGASLDYLYLSSNHLERVSDATLKCMRKLKRLFLGRNPIHRYNQSFYFKQLAQMNVIDLG